MEILKRIDEFFINHFERELKNSQSPFRKPYQYDNRWYDGLMVLPVILWFSFKFKKLEDKQ